MDKAILKHFWPSSSPSSSTPFFSDPFADT